MKTKYELRQARWKFVKLWGLFFLLLFIWGLACDGTGGDVRRPEPQKPKCEYRYDFSGNAEGSFPTSDWWGFGTDKVQPKVVTKDGNKGLLFNAASGPAGDKFVIAATPDSRTNCQAAYVQVKLAIGSNNDFAGITGPHIGEGDYFRVGLNVYQDKIRLEEKVQNGDKQSITKDYPLNVNQPYWLKVAFDYNSQTASVYLSTNGTDFSFVAALNNLREIKGKFGLTTFGPNHPEVLFDDFVVMGEGTAPVVVPPTPTKPSEIKLVLDNEGLLISETDIWPEETVRAQFTVINQGKQPVTLRALLVVGRGPDDTGENQDFAPAWDVTIPAGGNYVYKAEHSFTKLGKYTFTATYNPYGGGFPAVPTPKEGVPNRAEAKVREKTAQERKWSAFFSEKYGFSIKSEGTVWTDEELNWLQTLMRDLPSTYYHLESLERIVKVKDLGRPGVAGQYKPFYREIKVPNGFTVGSSWLETVLNEEYRKICLPCYGDPEKRARIVLVHELTHALQYSDQKTKKYTHWSENPVVTGYFPIAGWDQTGTKIREDQIPCLPGYTLERWVTHKVIRKLDPGNFCIYAVAGGLEDMSDAAAYYVVAPNEIPCQARRDFIRERVFLGKTY